MAAGRPTLYEADKIGKQTERYLDLCEDKYYLPTVEGLAVHLTVARSTIYLWAQEYPEFSDILEQLLALQASMLIQNGLKNEYNAPITKMMLSKHKGPDGLPYTERSDITSGGQPITALTDEDRQRLDTLRGILNKPATE